MYIAWPSVIYTEPGDQRVLVRCGQYSMYVRAGYVNAVRSVICDRNADVIPDRPDDEDGDKPVVRPKGREPVPADAGEDGDRRPVAPKERQAIRDRIAASSQLAEPSVREAMGMQVDAFGRIDSRGRPSVDSRVASGSGRGAASAPAARPASRGSADVGSSGGRATSAPSSRPSAGGSASAPSPRASGGDASSSSSGRASGRARVD